MKYGKILELELINNREQRLVQTVNGGSVDNDVYWFIIVTFVFLIINAFGIFIVVILHGEEDSESDVQILKPF
jgi:hypothetical protein